MAYIFRQFLLYSNHVSCLVSVNMTHFTLRQETLQQTAISTCIRRRANKAYSGADKSLARPGRKEANVSVRMA